VDKSKHRGWRVCAGASACVIAASSLLTQAAFAQQTKSTSTPGTVGLEEVVVTGIRASLRNSLDVKRDSSQILDAISAEDIGQFPDKNLSEALQRVTGVQISRQDGEGRSVSVRGADPNLIRVEINGTGALPLTVGASDRAVDFRDLPVEFVSRLEVVKTPTADMTEGGISTVRIITRRPFDSTEPFIAGSAQAVYSDLAEATDPKLAVIGSHLFFNDTLGTAVAAMGKASPVRCAGKYHRLESWYYADELQCLRGTGRLEERLQCGRHMRLVPPDPAVSEQSPRD